MGLHQRGSAARVQQPRSQGLFGFGGKGPGNEVKVTSQEGRKPLQSTRTPD